MYAQEPEQQQQQPLVSFDDIPGSLPGDDLPKDYDPSPLKSALTAVLPELLSDLRPSDFADSPIALWRDLLALTGNLRTFSSGARIATLFSNLSKNKGGLKDVKVVGEPHLLRLTPGNAWVDIPISFRTEAVLEDNGTKRLGQNCAGMIGLIPVTRYINGGEADGRSSGIVDKEGRYWKIWMLRTWLEGFEGLPAVDSWTPNLAVEQITTYDANKPDIPVIIVGAGQCGLSIAGRLKAAGIQNLVLERNEKVGDNWGNRYDSLKFHLIKEVSTLPYDDTYGPEEPVLLPQKNIAAAFNRWSKKFDIDARCSVRIQDAKYSDATKNWTVTFFQAGGAAQSLTCRHLILALGKSNTLPNIPQWPGREKFQGRVVHSVDYKSAAGWKGKNGIIVGVGNTAHDVAEDMADEGMESVTMIQRGRTWVAPQQWANAGWEHIYRLGLPTDTVDRMEALTPLKVGREITQKIQSGLFAAHPEQADALEKVGFKVDRSGDTFSHVFSRPGGHYVDTGASARIISGEIKIKSGVAITGYTSNGFAFADGSELEADVIVLGTGFIYGMKKQISDIVGEDVAGVLDTRQGINEEGEPCGAFMPNKFQRGLWQVHGDVRAARFNSKWVAMQIQADLVGAPLEVYYRD